LLLNGHGGDALRDKSDSAELAELKIEKFAVDGLPLSGLMEDDIIRCPVKGSANSTLGRKNVTERLVDPNIPLLC
jgi:hypothetical protein